MSKSDQPKPAASDLAKRRDYGPRAAAAPFELSQEPVTPQGPSKPRPPGAVPAPAFEHLGELPTTYGTYSLYLVAYDPHQLFAYWDIDWTAAAGKQFVLQVKRADGSVESRLTLASREVSRYIGISEPGGKYSVELTARGRDGQWKALATSGPVTMPPEGVSVESEEPAFATLPFHLSFQRLVELLKTVMRPREELTDALARLQRGGQVGATAIFQALDGLGQEQLQTLNLLVKENPQEFMAPEAAPTGVFGASEGLSSGVASSPNRWAQTAFSSEMLSSRGRPFGPLASVGGMGSESLSSAEWGRRALSSALGMGSESLSSAAQARGSEILGGAARPGAFGLSSEAWRKAAAAAGSESLSSQQGSMAFVRAVQTNLDVLGSLFSAAVTSQLNGGASSSTSSRGRW